MEQAALISEEVAVDSSTCTTTAEHEGFSIGKAAELLGTKYHKDYKKYFEMMCKDQGRNVDDALRTYVESILQDTLAWLESFPENLHSKSAYSKPKTAMLNLLSDSTVKTALGDDYCQRASKEIEVAFKAHSNVIVEKRLAGSTKKRPGANGQGSDGQCVESSDGGDEDDKAACASFSAEESVSALEKELEDTKARLDGLKNLVLRMAELSTHTDPLHMEMLRELMQRW